MMRNEKLQVLCRDYLCRLRETAKDVGLLSWLNKTVAESENNKCEATEEPPSSLSTKIQLIV